MQKLSRFILAAGAFTFAFPRLCRGQQRVQIDSSAFVAWMEAPGGVKIPRDANHVPLDLWTCYEWRVHVSPTTRGDVAWTEEFELPEPGTWTPSDDYEVRRNGRLAVSKGRSTPEDGWISKGWCVNDGDPVGKYLITVSVEGSPARSFEFFVVAVTPEVDSVIAEVLGQQIRMSQRWQMAGMISVTLLNQYVQEHRIASTEHEVRTLRQKQPDLTPEQAMGLLVMWKLRQSLFRQYGGRVVAQADGPEPVDAYRDLLKDQQRRGTFRILDQRLEPGFWASFVVDSTRPVLSPDSARKAFDKPWWEDALPSQAPDATSRDPLAGLAGEWLLDVFVQGAGQFAGPNCGQRQAPGRPLVTIAPPTDGAVSLAVSCNDGSDYAVLLRSDSGTGGYALTVRSRAGISVQDFPVAYAAAQGWSGRRDEQVDGRTQSVTAMVSPIEGRNWYGWSIRVLPTAGIGHEDDLKKAFFRADLTRRK